MRYRTELISKNRSVIYVAFFETSIVIEADAQESVIEVWLENALACIK